MRVFKICLLMLVLFCLANCALADELIFVDEIAASQDCEPVSQMGPLDYQFDADMYGGGYYGSPYEQSYAQYDWGGLTAFGWLQMLVFVAVAFIGNVVHFWVDVKKIGLIGGWGGLYRYFFVDHVKTTVSAVISMFVAAGTFFTINPIPVSWPMLVFSAFFVGYATDSMFNRGVTHYG